MIASIKIERTSRTTCSNRSTMISSTTGARRPSCTVAQLCARRLDSSTTRSGRGRRKPSSPPRVPVEVRPAPQHGVEPPALIKRRVFSNRAFIRRTPRRRGRSESGTFDRSRGARSSYESPCAWPEAPSDFPVCEHSAMSASVVSIRLATLAAFWSAERTTFAGSMTPIAIKSPY